MKEEKKEVMTPTENQFSLSKVKLLKGGGLDVHYEVTEIVGQERYTNKYHVECVKDIHPDLQNLFDALRPILARVFSFTSFLSMMETPAFKSTKSQMNLAREFADECIENIEVRGITLSGQGDNIGVTIMGMYRVSETLVTNLCSPRLKYETETFGFEETLEDIVASIEIETYAFLFKGKKAQLELFGDDMEPAGETEETCPGLFEDGQEPINEDEF